MAEYIERQLAENELGKAMPRLETPDGRGERDYEIEIAQTAFVDAISVIQRLPAADVEPVVLARWKFFKKKNKAVCTNCSYARDLDWNLGRAVACPNCGATMDT